MNVIRVTYLIQNSAPKKFNFFRCFRGLKSFGRFLIEDLSCLEMNNPMLDSVTFVDTPGFIMHRIYTSN